MSLRLGLVACLLAAGVVVAPGRSEATATGAGLFAGGAPVPMVDASIEIDVRMGIAHGVVRQRFHNVRTEAIEAVYVFPLPTGATVEAMAVTLGGTTVTGVIARRAEASARYQAAVTAGRAAALIEAERPGVFTQSIAPVPAGGDVEITLRWQAALVRRDGTWELAHPLVVGPRYVPGRATGKPTTGGGVLPDTDRAPDASRVTPPSAIGAVTPYRLTVQLDDADTITSPSHPLAIERTDRAARIVLADARGDRELVLRWTTAPQVRAIGQLDGKGGAWLAVLIEAERAGPPPSRAARRWIVAIDRSPSLDGAAAAAARRVADALIARLGSGDAIAVVAIGDTPRFAADHAAARRALAELPSTGSDLTRGLAVTLANLPRDPAPEVVVITDGLVADDAAAIERAATAGVHVHTVGVGGAPNRWLLGAIAARTSGTMNVVTSIDDADAVAATIGASDRASPITVDWRSPTVADVETTSPRLAPGGATLLVAQSPVGIPRGEIVVSIGSRKLRAPFVTVDAATLASSWGTLRVQRLYAAGDREAATRVALALGVVAPTTALVATVATGGDPVRSTITVPLPIPIGTRRTGVITEQLDGAGDRTPVEDPKEVDNTFDDVARDGRGGAGTKVPATNPTIVTADVGATQPAPPPSPQGEASGGDAGADDDAPSRAYATESLALGGTTSVLGRSVERYLVVGSLGLGARLDADAPAALGSLGLYRMLPRFFAAGLRLDLGVAPTADDPITAATLLSLSSSGRGLLRLDGGFGLGWNGSVAAAYQLGLFAGRHGVGLSLRLSGLAGPETRSTTLGLGVEASF